MEDDKSGSLANRLLRLIIKIRRAEVNQKTSRTATINSQTIKLHLSAIQRAAKKRAD